MARKQHVIILLSLLFGVVGCSESPLALQVRYQDVSGLTQGDPVYFKHNQVGSVEAVTYTAQGDYLVSLAIVPGFKNAATVDSKFVIDNDPNNPQSRAVLISQDTYGGKVLEQDAIVEGAVKVGLLDQVVDTFKKSTGITDDDMQKILKDFKKSLSSASQKLDEGMDSALDDLSRRFHTFNEEMQKVPDSREVQELEKSIQNFADEFKKSQKNVREKIRREVLPQLRQELDRLRDKLQQENREKEVDEIDKEVSKITMV